MTLIVSWNGPQATVMASDRLVTLASSVTGRFLRDYDRMSNKMVVLVMRDAVVSIGYTGSAFIAGKHTDDWIAEMASPGATIFDNLSSAMHGFKIPSRLRLHQLCNRLRLGLMSKNVISSTAIHLAGWRLKRNRLIPISIFLRASSPFGADPETRLRSRREPGTSSFGYAGVSLNQQGIAAGFQSIAGRPFDVEAGRDMLTNIIRAKAAIDPAVGPHVMSVILYHPSTMRIDCRFDPLQRHYGSQTINGQDAHLPVGYSPWILTPGTFYAPTETTGLGAGTWMVDGWTIEIEDASPGLPTLSTVHWSRPQTRVPPLN